MSKLLQKQYGFRREHMVEMTSSDCYGPDHNANFGGQIRDTLPTYGNIISSFMTIIKEGKPGDLAYIHFSGVITTVQSILPAYAELPAVSDLALLTASCDATSEGEKFLLHDVELSALLNTLCEKGLEVTAFLDCRHALLHDFPSSRSDLSLLEPNELKAMSYGKMRHHSARNWIALSSLGIDILQVMDIAAEETALGCWPRRLLHLPTLTSYEWQPGNTYGSHVSPA